MKTQLMAAVSVLALMIALPAAAADYSYSAGSSSGEAARPAYTKDNSLAEDIKSGLRSADDAIRGTAENIKAFFIGKDADSKLEPVLIPRSVTAHGMLGSSIVNTQGEKIANVKDIIINKNGRASMLVVSDAGLLGIGTKVAAFDYNRIVTQKPDGDVVMVLSQDMIDRAADFSYDQQDWAKAKVIPAGSISANELLDGDVLDNEGKKVASIENIHLRGNDVSQIIVGFDKTLGMGGDLAALDYDELRMIRKDKGLDFKLTANQSAQFKNFKARAAGDMTYAELPDDIKVLHIGKNANDKLEPVLIRRGMTAHGMLGRSIINTQGKKIATVKDVIIGKNGKAILLVVSDRGFLGIGSKMAAFDYNKVVTESREGMISMVLTEDMVERAADFSYDAEDRENAKVLPAGSISVNALLKGDVLDHEGKKVASIENVYLRHADVSQIVVGFDKTLGMGGYLAALDYDDLQMIRKDNGLDFKLTPNQSAQFKNFKVSVAN